MAWKHETWQDLFKSWLAANARANAAAKAKGNRTKPRPETPGGAAVAMDLSVGTTHNWFHGEACPHWNDVDQLAKDFGVSRERILRAINVTKGPNPKHAAQAAASKASRAKFAAKRGQPAAV